MIKITLPDNSIREVAPKTTIIEFAKSISSSLGKATTSAVLNGKVVDLRTELIKDSTLQILTDKDKESLEALRHSFAHITAAALRVIRPDAKFGVGPAIEEGFYYDVDVEPKLTDEDLATLEKEMNKIIKAGIPMTKEVVSKEEALKIFAQDKYKVELINDLPDGEVITTYAIGDKFIDLCRGLHLQNTSHAKNNFKLLSLAGSYWRGDSNREQLQRIYGTAFFAQKELAEHLVLLEERKERDHRKLGKDQKIFMMNHLAGQGCPIWLPDGFIVRKILADYFYKTELKYGHQHVITPIMGSVDLYKTSGHWENYKENMFPVMENENEQLVLRPMTCPHHMLIYKNEIRSYNDLPLRIAENAILHRFESSGSLTGLERVRAMNLTDTHIFVTPKQIKGEMKHLWKLIQEVIAKLNLDIHYVELALRGKEGKYHDDDKMWDESEKVLKEVLEDLGIEYKAMEDEAAFYGPKIDLQVKTVLGHVITLATLQLDFLLPERFKLEFINDKGEKQRPVVIHRGLVGTYERLMSILLEQYKGAFPVWMAPIQAVILPVSNDQHLSYAHNVFEELNKYGIRAKIIDSKERLSYRIREAQTSKIPYQVVIGDDEKDTQKINIRRYGSSKEQIISVSDFIKQIKDSE